MRGHRFFKGWQASSSGATDGGGQYVVSGGDRVLVRFDADGVHVDNNWDDNRNDNIGLASARKSPLCLVTGVPIIWWALSLPSFYGPNPSAEHAPNLVH